MNSLGKLDTVSSLSLAVAAAALVAGWIATSADATADSGRRLSREDAVTLTPDGRMQMTVTVEPRQSRIPVRT